MVKKATELSRAEDIEDMVKANAVMALDQRTDTQWADAAFTNYAALQACLDSYYENATDTAIEMGIKHPCLFESYRAHVRAEAAKLGVELPEDYR